MLKGWSIYVNQQPFQQTRTHFTGVFTAIIQLISKQQM